MPPQVRRRSRLGWVKHRIKRMRNRIADLLFLFVVIPACVATILFAIDSCQNSRLARGGLAEPVRPEISR
jgi:hypothetical protein